MLAAWMALMLAGPARAVATPLGLPCESPRAGRVYCATEDLDTRVPSFDGTLLDVDLTGPAGATAPTPLVVMRHGYGGTRSGPANADVHWWVDRGYRVLTYAARGHGRSDGVAHWDDPRYEPRDTQHLVGRLVDEGLVDPDGIAVTGTSYGGGQSATLAALDDRVMLADGSLAPWESPGGVPLHLAAAVPVVGWTDLAQALAPDGRELDYAELPDPAARPVGIPLSSWNALLDAWPDLRVDAGMRHVFSTWANDPMHVDDPAALAVGAEARTHHSAAALYDGRPPAPTLFAHGWDDELFPLREATRAFDYYRSVGAPVRMAVADYGHGRSQNKAADVDFLTAQGRAWIDHYVRGEGPAPAPGVAYRTMTCPAVAASRPEAALPSPLQTPGEVRLHGPAGSLDEQGDEDGVYDVIYGRPFCERQPDDDPRVGVAVRGATVGGAGYTLVGAPTVSGDFAVTGDDAQVDARLFDESDAGRILVARGVWRPEAGHGVFQLHAAGWRFEAGHRPVLELAGTDAGYVRASSRPFRVDAEGLEVRLPVAEPAGSAGGAVQVPLPYDVPSGYRLTPAAVAREAALDAMPAPAPSPAPTATPTPAPTARPAVSPTPTPVLPARVGLSVRRPSRPRARRQPYRLLATSAVPIASVRFSGPRLGVTDVRAPFAARVRLVKGRRLQRVRFRATARLRDGRRVVVGGRARLPRRPLRGR